MRRVEHNLYPTSLMLFQTFARHTRPICPRYTLLWRGLKAAQCEPLYRARKQRTIYNDVITNSDMEPLCQLPI